VEADKMKDTELLKQHSLFSGLDDIDLKNITDISLERTCKKNTILFMEGEPGDAFYYIKSGKVKVFRAYEDGKEHIVHILGVGDVFGEATLFTRIPYPASASIYEDAVIGIIKNNDLESIISSSPELSLTIIKILAGKLVLSQQKIRELTFNDVYARISSQILKFSDELGVKTEKGIRVDMDFSRQDLADMVGTTRETVSRVISRFKKEKSIVEDNDGIIILNKEKLMAWIKS
jgi:CRP/FNR family transcriptional regulator